MYQEWNNDRQGPVILENILVVVSYSLTLFDDFG